MARNDDSWLLIQDGFDPRTFKAWEGLFTLGGPGLHVRGSLEEPLACAPQNEEYERAPANVTSEVMRHPISKWGTYAPGVYGRHPVLGMQLINLPWFLWLVPIVDGERLDMMECEILAHERRLNMKDAILSRTLRWRTRTGTIVQVAHERFVSAAEPGVCVQSMTVRSDTACDLVIESGIDADVRTNGFDHFHAIELQESEDDLLCRVATDCGQEIELRSHIKCDGARVAHRDERRAWWMMSLGLDAERPMSVAKRSEVRRSDAMGKPGLPVGGRGSRNRATGERSACPWHPERERTAHVIEGRKRCNGGDIEIDGDAESQRAIRAAIFHLLRAHPGEETDLAIDAKGYAGEAYWGRFFWDTEIYLLPFYLHTNPALARGLLEFRVRTLPAAMENARARGFAGAKYPWEAGPDGTEECPNAIYADQEVHITADVVYGIARYVAATDDDEFLARDDVQRVLVETSRYWMSRIDWSAGAPHLNGVMGPDEYTPHSNDNAFTNGMVAFALRFAAEQAKTHGTEAERSRWLATANELPVHRHPHDPSLILQCEGFDRLSDFDFAPRWTDRSRTLGAQVPLEDLYCAKALKQADVILLMLLHEKSFSEQERRRAWDYYLPLTTHDSSLSPATHALFAARLGLGDEAWHFWQRACAIDLDVAHGGAAEGIHIANCGMLWQTIVHGFGGIAPALQSRTLTLQPRLPERWSALRFPLRWLGTQLHVEISRESVQVRNLDSCDAARVTVRNEPRSIAPAAIETWMMRS